MRVEELRRNDFETVRQSFYDVFTQEPWCDRWENGKQLTAYLKELTGNSNSLSLVLKDESGEIVGAALGYTFHWWAGFEYYIKEFYIVRHKQRQGLGSLFLRLILHYLGEMNIKAVYLFTGKDVPACRFYLNNGFIESKDTVFLSKNID